MPEISAFGFMGSQASQGLFGANVLATRSDLEQGGDYDRLIEELGVGSFRYPGGSLTERYFDISNPNASVVLIATPVRRVISFRWTTRFPTPAKRGFL